MLMAVPETVAPKVVCPLRAEGCRNVSFGVMSDYNHPVEFVSRLTDNETFSMIEMPQLPLERESAGRLTTSAYRTKRIDEVFCKATNLTGQDLIIGQRSLRMTDSKGLGTKVSACANVAYVKLQLMSDEENDALLADSTWTDTKRIFVHNDAHGVHHYHYPTNEEEIRHHIEVFRGSDFSHLYWEAGGGDELNYFTKNRADDYAG